MSAYETPLAPVDAQAPKVPGPRRGRMVLALGIAVGVLGGTMVVYNIQGARSTAKMVTPGNLRANVALSDRFKGSRDAAMKTITNFSDPALSWVHEPDSWHIDAAKNTLEMNPPLHGDLWMRTYYPWARYERRFNASALVADVPFWQNASLEVEFTLTPAVFYDQAGAVVLIDADTWVKAGIENFAIGGPHLSVVVTNDGFSDWSTKPLPWDNASAPEGNRSVSLKLRVTKLVNNMVQGASLYVENWDESEARWNLVRLLPVRSSQVSWQMGPMACAPTPPAHTMRVVFTKMVITPEVMPCLQC